MDGNQTNLVSTSLCFYASRNVSDWLDADVLMALHDRPQCALFTAAAQEVQSPNDETANSITSQPCAGDRTAKSIER
jgi:hypothetical protein